jgi:hypothetical protein
MIQVMTVMIDIDMFNIDFILLDTFRSNNPENGFLSGKLRISADGKNEELIAYGEKAPLKQDQPEHVQPCEFNRSYAIDS